MRLLCFDNTWNGWDYGIKNEREEGGYSNDVLAKMGINPNAEEISEIDDSDCEDNIDIMKGIFPCF